MTGKDAVRDLLRKEEILLEFSPGRARMLSGTLCGLAGAAVLADSVIHFMPAVSGFLILMALVLLYLGYRLLVLVRQEFVGVTDQRVLYQRLDFLGRKKPVMEIPLEQIQTARVCRTTVMFGRRHSGDAILRLKSGKEHLIPSLENAEYIVEAIDGELPRIAAEANRTSEDELLAPD